MVDIFNNWLALGVLASVLLGFYDVFKKIALKKYDIFTVLFYSSIFSGLLVLPLVLLSYFFIIQPGDFWYITPLNSYQHLLIFIKSLVLSTVWILAFKSMQNLPISVVTPVLATDSIWTFLGAFFISNEKINLYQWLALLIIIFSFFYFSRVGKKEGIYFLRNRYIVYIVIASILGTCGNLYDKYLMDFLEPLAVLTWVSFYNILIFFIYKTVTSGQIPRINYTDIINRDWRSIVPIALIGIVIVMQDFTYFNALALDGSMVSVLTAIKRSSTALSFLIGALIFKENLLKKKFYSLLGILAGVFLLLLNSN